MSQFHFGVGRGRVRRDAIDQIHEVAERHGADFVNVEMPEGWRYWFSCPNLGAPFDNQTARAVYCELGALELWPPPLERSK